VSEWRTVLADGIKQVLHHLLVVIQLPHSVDARALADGDGDSAAHPHLLTASLAHSLRHSVTLLLTHTHTHTLTHLLVY
jgi:hypothetical protein